MLTLPTTAARELALKMALGKVQVMLLPLVITIMCVRRLRPIRRMTLACGGIIPKPPSVPRF